MDFQIRRVVENDLVLILAINENLNRSSAHSGFNWDHWSQESLIQSFKNEEGLALVNLADRPVAFVFWATVGPKIFEIRKLATDPLEQRNGLMMKLISYMVREVIQGGQIWLEAHERNLKARNLYEKLGFLKVGSRPNYYQDGGAAILYSFPL